jgi:putative NADPH-quinone reductase
MTNDRSPRRRILVVQGHPDPAGGHLCHALAGAYAGAARQAGHAVTLLDVAALDFPLLRSAHDWQHGPPLPALAPAQQALLACEHVLMLFPLWLGDMPALLKGFLEQVARPGFAFPKGQATNPFAHKALSGRSARVVVTMGMPALVYRHFYRAHAVKALERNILGFIGFGPVHETLIGNVEGADAAQRAKWLAQLATLGAQAT